MKLFRLLSFLSFIVRSVECFSPPCRNHIFEFSPETKRRGSLIWRQSCDPQRVRLVQLKSAASVSSREDVGSDSEGEPREEAKSTTRRSTTTDIKEPQTPLLADGANKYDLPWGDIQKWALRDHLAKFTVQVPVNIDGKDTIKVYTLWRSLVNEVTELSGYPLPFLLDRYAELKALDEITVHTSDTVLPYLDRYAFEPNGGLSGLVSGVLGVAEGTRIQTTPVGDVHETIPKGFVRTEDGKVIYELGMSDVETVQIGAIDKGNKYNLGNQVSEAVNSMSTDASLPQADIDGNLVRLGALSTAVLGGAFALQALSHHVTVNIFWV